jgi:hypothetical protein
VVKIASTTGGFLIGFGLCLLLVSFGAYAVLGQYYSQIMEWRDEVEQIYAITHSSAYEASMNALETLSPYANQIADALSNPLISWGLGWLAEPLRQIGGAGSNMRNIYDASETAYQAIAAVEVAPQLLVYGIVLGLVLMVVGMMLVAKAKRKS